MDAIHRIQHLIRKHYPSDAAFERKLEIKPKTVDSWKRGNSDGYMKMLPDLAAALHTSTAYLLCETDDPTPPGEESPAISGEAWAAAERFTRLSPENRARLLDHLLLLERLEGK